MRHIRTHSDATLNSGLGWRLFQSANQDIRRRDRPAQTQRVPEVPDEPEWASPPSSWCSHPCGRPAAALSSARWPAFFQPASFLNRIGVTIQGWPVPCATIQASHFEVASGLPAGIRDLPPLCQFKLTKPHPQQNTARSWLWPCCVSNAQGVRQTAPVATAGSSLQTPGSSQSNSPWCAQSSTATVHPA